MDFEERQGRVTQVAAWLWVAAMHAGLFWLLTHQDQEWRVEKEGPRLRLVFVTPIRTPTPSLRPTPSSVSPTRAELPVASVRSRPSAVFVVPTAQTPEPGPGPATTEELQAQGRQWARENFSPAFATDPFRDRRAHLPGGDQRGRFRMKEPLSPEKILSRIGQTFGGSGYSSSPCPRIQSNLPGLLTATSAEERELMEEELRRDREYCRP